MLTTPIMFDLASWIKNEPMEQHTSIEDLPIELLLSVFRWSVDITSLQKDRCRLSLVCRYWRDVVQESACLWTDISAHDPISYIRLSLGRSPDLPIDIHYLSHGSHRLETYLASFINLVVRHLSRCRSISFITDGQILFQFDELFLWLRATPPPDLESLALKAGASQRYRQNIGAESSLPELPGMTAFPKLRRLEIDGITCKISLPGLLLNNVRSLNLIDVINVEGEQLLEVLRNSPHLERLELGRSPLAYPSQPALAPIHLPRLMALHLIFMPIQVSNFLLTTIQAPNCSELSISSYFPELPDDVVRERLFTSNTKHFSPVLQKLLTQGQYKDIDVFRLHDQSMEFDLQFYDEDFDDSGDRGILRLEFKLHSVGQVEATVQWLTSCFNRDMPKIPVRLFICELEEVHLVNLFDSHMAITHLALSTSSGPGAIQPNRILTHMAHPTPSGWPLPDLEVFSYGVVEEGRESHSEMMLDMLRRRYGSSPESGSERPPPRLLRRIRIVVGWGNCVYLLGEVQKILPQTETSLIEEDDSIW